MSNVVIALGADILHRRRARGVHAEDVDRDATVARAIGTGANDVADNAVTVEVAGRSTFLNVQRIAEVRDVDLAGRDAGCSST